MFRYHWGMEQGIHYILVLDGIIMLLWGMIYSFLECLQAPGTSRGTDISSSRYWLISAVVLPPSTLPLLSHSRFRTGVFIIPLSLLCSATRRLINTPGLH